MLKKIPGNVEEDSGECWRWFQGMLKKIPGNVWKDSREFLKRFQGMFEEIPGNVPEDSGDVSKDSGECWQRFSRMLKKIEHFIIQLN